MGPMHHPAAIVGLILALEADRIALAQRHAARQVDVVGNQNRLLTAKTDDKSLMPITLCVIGKRFADSAGGFNDRSGALLSNDCSEVVVRGDIYGRGRIPPAALLGPWVRRL